MKSSNFFNINRFILLIRRQVLSGTNILFIAFGAITGLLLLISGLVAYFSPEDLADMTNLYYVAMFLGGYIYTSNTFNELHNPQRSYRFLTLPVSTFERLAGAWLLSAVLFPVVAILAMVIVVFLSNLIINFTVDPGTFSNIFSHTTLVLIGIYFVTQSVFLLGAIYFRKHNFLKTLLALFVVYFAISLYVSLAGLIIFRPWEYHFSSINQFPTSRLEHFFTDLFPGIMKIIFWYVMAPFFLIVSYFSLKERQV